MDSDSTKSNLTELQLDVEELEKLLGQASRPAVKALLLEEVTKRNQQVRKMKELPDQPSAARSTLPPIKIINYAWDQSDNFVKLFVTLNRVQDLPGESVTTTFGSKSMDLLVSGLEGKNYGLKMTNLHSAIDPVKSYHKVKQDTVIVFMKKMSSKNWPSVSALDQKPKDLGSASKSDDTADPSDSIMNLMKKMYDDGDDEMKRSIAKAWYEARDKQKDDTIPELSK